MNRTAEARMRSNLVVVSAPSLGDDLCLGAASKPLEAQALVTKLVVKALVGRILPRLAWIDQRRIDLWNSAIAVSRERRTQARCPSAGTEVHHGTLTRRVTRVENECCRRPR